MHKRVLREPKLPIPDPDLLNTILQIRLQAVPGELYDQLLRDEYSLSSCV